jgi:putative peptidoglycan lipid II flippase
MKLIRSIATISGYTAGSRVFGFLREILMAYFLGAGLKSDALVIAIKLPSILRRLFAEGAFNTTFVPMFARLLAGDKPEEARSFAEEILSILTFSLALLVIIVEVILPWIMPIVVPGFIKTPERLALAIEYSRITFPFIFFISLTALYSGILNSLERFVAVASSPMMGNVGIILVVFALVPFAIPPGHAFSVGIAFCGVIQFLWVLYPAYKSGMSLRLKLPRLTPRVKKFLLLAGPAAAGSGIVQINILLDTLIASLLPAGGVSYIHYADRLNQLPLSMLGTAVGTALLPLLSKKLRSNDIKGAIESQNLALEYALLFVLPAAIGLIFLAQPLMKVLFERGDFGPTETRASAHALMALASGLPAYIMIKIFSTSFFARQDTKTPVKFAILSVVINLILNLTLIWPLKHVGLALSTSIAAWINAILLATTLWRQGFLVLNPRIKRFFPRLLIASSLTVVFIESIRPVVFPLISDFILQNVFCLTLLIAASLGMFVLLARLTGALDFKDLRFQLKSS